MDRRSFERVIGWNVQGEEEDTFGVGGGRRASYLDCPLVEIGIGVPDGYAH